MLFQNSPGVLCCAIARTRAAIVRPVAGPTEWQSQSNECA